MYLKNSFLLSELIHAFTGHDRGTVVMFFFQEMSTLERSHVKRVGILHPILHPTLSLELPLVYTDPGIHGLSDRSTNDDVEGKAHCHSAIDLNDTA